MVLPNAGASWKILGDSGMTRSSGLRFQETVSGPIMSIAQEGRVANVLRGLPWCNV
jgi:hypothetical protein